MAEPVARAPSRIEPARVERPKVPASAQARRARTILLAAPLALLAVFFGTRLVASGLAARYADRLKQAIATRTDAEVGWSRMRLGFNYQPCVEGFGLERQVRNLSLTAKADEACVDRWASAVGSGFRAVRVRLESPVVRLAGASRAAGVAAAVEPARAPVSLGPTSGERRVPALREYEIVFDDLRVDWSGLPLPERFSIGQLGPLDGTVSFQRRGTRIGASADLREATTGLEVSGRAAPTPDGWDLQGRIEGDLAPSFGRYLAAVGLDVRRLPIRGDVGAAYSTARERLTVDLNLEQQDVDVQQESLSSARMVGFNARQEARIVIDFGRPRLWINKGKIDVNGVMAEFSLDVLGGEDRPSPAFTFEFHLKTIPVAKLLGSLPGSDTTELARRIPPGVLFALDFALRGELKDPSTWDPELEHRIIGVKESGSGLEYLFGEFEYKPLTSTGRAAKGIVTGPKTPTWVKYSSLPTLVRRSIQVSEDASFFRHRGLDMDGIRSAIVQGFSSGEKTRGGSTLTQQLVKNLFLSRERTAQRKVRELVLSFLIETAMSKEQILELYANVIEWGPGIYGIHAAADHYFGTTPGGLTVKEIAYLTSIIPGPILYHKHYEQGYVSARHDAKVRLLLDRLLRAGALDAQTHQAALAEPIRFHRKGKLRTVDPSERVGIDAAELAAESEPAPGESPGNAPGARGEAGAPSTEVLPTAAAPRGEP